jgi:hypothetical protein
MIAVVFALALAPPSLAVFDSSQGRVEASFIPPHYVGARLVPYRVEFRGPGQAKALRVPFDVGGPYAVALWQITVDGLPDPTVAVVSSWLAADRVVIEPALIAPVEHESRELLPNHPDLDTPSAACLYPAVDGRAPLLTTARWTGGHCVICWPKPFVITRYEFDGQAFRRKWQLTTPQSFEDSGAVIAHYGIPCDLDLVAASEDRIVKRGEITETAAEQ